MAFAASSTSVFCPRAITTLRTDFSNSLASRSESGSFLDDRSWTTSAPLESSTSRVRLQLVQEGRW